MSSLKERLQAQKSKLAHTTTVVRTADGRTFKEDQQRIEATLRQMVADRVYPENLWD